MSFVRTPEAFVDGMTPASYIGGILAALAAAAAVALPRPSALKAVLVG